MDRKLIIEMEGGPEGIFPVPSESAFTEGHADSEVRELKNADFLASIELMAVGAALIEKLDSFENLREANISYLFKKKGGKGGGKLVLGKCIKPSGLARLYSSCDFVVWLAADYLRQLRFTNFQVEALIYHELCHADVKDPEGDRKLATIPHDWEGFVSEIERYGIWTPDMQRLCQAFVQLPLYEKQKAAGGQDGL